MAEPAPGGFDIRRILLLGGVVLVVLFASLFMLFRGCGAAGQAGKGYTVIYSNMDLRDAANVVARLKELAIPYEIRDDGRAIAVAKDRADQARLGLAEKNLPAGGVVGWEIFDEAKLGATDFDRRIQLIRAISGELSRTIHRIQAVEDVRVQIVIPETHLFAATSAPVTASVLLRLKPGAELTSEKINGIVHLVASSVENLQPENVTVVDNFGNILTAKISLPKKEAFVSFEQMVEVPKPAVAEEVPPTSEVKAVAGTAEVVSPEAAAAPLPSPPPLPPLTPEEGILLKVRAKKGLEEDLAGKAQEILNRFYPPNSVIVKVNCEVKSPPYKREFRLQDLKVKRVNAVILIDNRLDISKQLKQSTYQTVAAAIGYNRHRGDRILLQKVPFHLATPAPETVQGEVQRTLPFPPSEAEKKPFLPLGLYWLMGVAGTALIVFLILRLVRKPSPRVEAVEAEPEAKMPPSPKRASMIESIKSMAESNPERIAELLRSWLTE